MAAGCSLHARMPHQVMATLHLEGSVNTGNYARVLLNRSCLDRATERPAQTAEDEPASWGLTTSRDAKAMRQEHAEQSASCVDRGFQQ